MFKNYKKIIGNTGINRNFKSVDYRTGELFFNLTPLLPLIYHILSVWIRIHKVLEYGSNLNPDPQHLCCWYLSPSVRIEGSPLGGPRTRAHPYCLCLHKGEYKIMVMVKYKIKKGDF